MVSTRQSYENGGIKRKLRNSSLAWESLFRSKKESGVSCKFE
jgi:hypothetical protein